MDDLTLRFLVFGLLIVFFVFIIFAIILLYIQRNRHKHRVHLSNAKILSKDLTPSKLQHKSTNNALSAKKNLNLDKDSKIKNEYNNLESKTGFSQVFCTPLNNQNVETLSIPNNNYYENELMQSPELKNNKLRNVIVIDNYTEINNNHNINCNQLLEQKNLTTVSPKSFNNNKLSLKNRPFEIELAESKIETITSSGISPSTFISNNSISSSESINSNKNAILKQSFRKNEKDNLSLRSTAKISSKIEKLQENGNEMLYYEFEILNQEAMTSIKPRTTTAELNENIRKNRFFDILPYDFNRVKLKPYENEKKSDYINASYINLNDPLLNYIAAQGPIGEEESIKGRRIVTIGDFWQMIWQKKIDTIVMLTECFEENKQKCAMYWPENAGESLFVKPDLNVDLYCVTENEIYFQREMFLHKPNHSKRQIMQWQYKEWPNVFNAQDLTNFLTFIETVRSSKKKYPILVHCSAGVGRTGVYIAIDILFEKLERENVIDVFEIVSRLRELRTNMVQTSDQYLIVYEIIALAIRKRSSIRNIG